MSSRKGEYMEEIPFENEPVFQKQTLPKKLSTAHDLTQSRSN